jgi:hypothetical protein
MYYVQKDKIDTFIAFLQVKKKVKLSISTIPLNKKEAQLLNISFDPLVSIPLLLQKSRLL